MSKMKTAAPHHPTPAEVRQLRVESGLTQGAIAALLYMTDRTWRQWEAGDRHMHPALWELLNSKLTMKIAA